MLETGMTQKVPEPNFLTISFKFGTISQSLRKFTMIATSEIPDQPFWHFPMLKSMICLATLSSSNSPMITRAEAASTIHESGSLGCLSIFQGAQRFPSTTLFGQWKFEYLIYGRLVEKSLY